MYAEYLCEILDMDRAGFAAVEAADREGFAFHGAEPFREPSDGVDVDKVDLGHVDANLLCECHHREFIFGYALEAAGRQLHDPRSANALRRDREAPVFPVVPQCREFELHASE
jgi:hypothetical protein